MFDSIRAVRTTVDAERLRAQAAELQALLAEAGTRANLSAAHLAEQAKVQAALARAWASPHVEQAVLTARPRIQKALLDTRTRTEPQIEAAARRALPVVDTAHDKLVDELLPRVVAAVNAAAVAATAGADRARDVTSAKLTELGHIEPPKRSHTGRNVVLVLALAGAAGAAYQAWRRSGPGTDPWADQPWEAPEEDTRSRAAAAREEFQGVVDDVRHELGDRAEVVGERAGEAVAAAREATERAKEATRRSTSRRRSEGETETDATTTQAIPTGGVGDTLTEPGTAGELDAPAADVDVTPADVAGTIGSQLEGTPLDTSDAPGRITIEDGDERTR